MEGFQWQCDDYVKIGIYFLSMMIKIRYINTYKI